jgi:hypothetical protein
MKSVYRALSIGLLAMAVQASADSLGAKIAGCPSFPPDNIWNAPVDGLPVHVNSTAWVASGGPNKPLHPDFGTGVIGIPFIVVTGQQPKVPITFRYDDESDPGPYPIPASAPVEGGRDAKGDRHVLVLDRDNCLLYELYAAYPQPDGSWKAGSGAVFSLRSNALRPDGWTSTDAAGLPVLPGLVRYEEVAAGEIRHAIRMSIPQTQRKYVWPARHAASKWTANQYPPMGTRFRLKAGFDVSGFLPENQVILRALKKYGVILSDNGSAWFIQGVPDDRWNDERLHELTKVRGSDFEAVDAAALMVDANSGRARAATRTVKVFRCEKCSLLFAPTETQPLCPIDKSKLRFEGYLELSETESTPERK